MALLVTCVVVINLQLFYARFEHKKGVSMTDIDRTAQLERAGS